MDIPKKKEDTPKDFKAILWASADKLRAQMDAAEYKHLVLGMIFLKYISDTFLEQQNKVLEMVSNPDSDYYLGDDPKDHQEALEDRDYYTQDNVFWVPQKARWSKIRSQAKQTDIGSIIDKSMIQIENENKSLKGKLDKRFGESIWRYSYDHHVVGERDISILDDREFVLLRRKRNSVITTMYFIVFLAFIFFMSLMGDILIKITG